MKKTLEKYEPREYQKEAQDFIMDHDGAGLFLDMGLGKTVVTLTALKDMAWDWDHVLIIAPKNVALDTWPEELRKWEHLKAWAPSYEVAVGTKAQRERAVDKLSQITIINRENIPWLVDRWKARKKWPYDVVVIDELTSFKSPSAHRFKAMKQVRPKIKRLIGLTGTPLANGYMDLWAQSYMLDGGSALGSTITGYRNKYFTPGRRNGAVIYEWNLRPFADEEILDKLKPFCLTMRSEDYLQLPDRIDLLRGVKLSEAKMKLYKELERDQFLALDGEEIDAVNAAALTTKLMQLSSGEVYGEDKERIKVHDEKLKALDDLLEELEGENVLVFYQFIHEKDRLLERYKEAVDIKEKGAITRWKEGKIKMLVAHPASAGHGLNLQSGGSVIAWYSLPTSLELYQQAIKRLHRSGQQKPVRNIALICKETYEEKIYFGILKKKEKRQDALLAILKNRAQEILEK